MGSAVGLDAAALTLVGITLVAATVNGALGYGFSSLTVPVALVFYTNRVLNPALVLVEVVVNSWVLVLNRRSLPDVWRRTVPIIGGLVPGVAIGSLILSSGAPGTVKLMTYTLLLPLILLQAAGVRRPIRAERAVGVPFGLGLGVLYSMTTISGPPLALLFNNQGFVRQEFRAGLALVRILESTLTALAYFSLGLYSRESTGLLPLIVPSVLVGIPVGALVVRRLEAETFRRLCMSFDCWIVSFGLARTLVELSLLDAAPASLVFVGAALIDSWLLARFFWTRSQRGGRLAAEEAAATFH